MTYDEARDIVDKISHPFMLFTLESRSDEFYPAPNGCLLVDLRISHKCADARTLEHIIINRSRRMIIQEWTTEEHVVDEIWRCVKNAALHEAGEYFKYKGVVVHDPHTPATV